MKKKIFTGQENFFKNLHTTINFYFLFMHKTIFCKKTMQGILMIWFLLCILPGDCLLLGCVEGDVLHCAEKEAAVISHQDVLDSLPMDDQHCSHCCLLCTHNLVMGLLQKSFLFLNRSPRWVQTLHVNHFKSIFQTIIYHPPRFAA
ncbi:MAG: hypothetical protein L3J18_05890 [Candidatus Brocadia sp.]|nr:hypothetical protein [Candidatus Brocadia sp.]MDG5996142.1 hypothetical protein [Candidatus Brocadia sp.]UJS21839.1 MAG: hypothetical protein L3J18_05890 [Candidatus Brocadia sp.]